MLRESATTNRHTARNCQSLTLGFEEMTKRSHMQVPTLVYLFPLHRKAWKCRSCGREWGTRTQG